MKSLPCVLALAAAPAIADQVAEVDVDWVGNDIVVEAVQDPKVEGVTCHIAYVPERTACATLLEARLERRCRSFAVERCLER